MVDFKKIFEDSFYLLKNNKKIILPILFFNLVPILLVIAFIFASGLFPLIKDLEVADAEFEKQKEDYLLQKENIGEEDYGLELLSYLGRDSGNSPYDDQFGEYLAEEGFDFERFIPLWNTKNMILLIISIVLYIASMVYFSIMSYTMIVKAIQKKKQYNLPNLTNKLILKFIVVKILLTLILIAPIFIMMFFVATPPRSVAIILFVLVIFYFAYLIYMSLRLFFAIPLMFFEGTGAVKSIKYSFTSTKGHLKQVLFIAAIILGIALLSNSLVGEPLYSASAFFYESGAVKILINFLLMLVFVVLYSIALTFQRVFLFYSYIYYNKAYIKKARR
jgi:hypothetical protein